MKINIGSREIGEGCPAFIVAEVGSNWATLDDCMTSISLAKACGADAVKFQAYDTQSLYGLSVKGACEATVGKHLSPECISKELPGTLPLKWLPKLKEKADACGIEFMCSAFSPELIDVVDRFVNIHKVASAELTHKRMLEKLSKIGKPVLLSTGASGEADIHEALRTLRPAPTVLLYCVAAYPTRLTQPKTIRLMRETFRVPVGFSDHSIDAITIPYAASLEGACVIEKHVNFVGAQGPDAPHSLSTDEFKLMVQSLRGKPVSTLGPTQEEQGMVLRHNRRLIATQALRPGDQLREGVNFGIYRSLKDDTHALSPWAIDLVAGRIATKAIEAGAGIGPGDYQ